MKKKTREKLIKGGIVGALGAAAAGGAAYLLSNKNRFKCIIMLVRKYLKTRSTSIKNG